MEKYEYQNWIFYLKQVDNQRRNQKTYTIVDFKGNGVALAFPKWFNGTSINSVDLKENQYYPGIKEVYFNKNLLKINLYNNNFPDLKQVKVALNNPNYSSDGLMLYDKTQEKLYKALAGNWLAQIEIPGKVKSIKDLAFENAMCHKIIFNNANVRVEKDSFKGSRWLNEQKDCCIIGNLLYRACCTAKVFVFPERIKRVFPSAFQDEALEDVTLSPNLFTSLLNSAKMNHLQIIRFTERKGTIDLIKLRQLPCLQHIEVAKDNLRYATIDGVLFSKDLKQLIYYPPKKEAISYHIFEGVVKIGYEAFKKQRHLVKVTMADSVKQIGASAFYYCAKLREIIFSPNIKELVDANQFESQGMFEHCLFLKSVVLPEKLTYLGSYTFFDSGLKEITLNIGLKNIGEYALCAPLLKEIIIPRTVMRIGRGALFFTEQIDAYFGRAKGLISAINAVLPRGYENNFYQEWHRCQITAHRINSKRVEKIIVPGSLAKTQAHRLEMAWNNSRFDYEEYDSCFEYIKMGKERIEFAGLGIMRLKRRENNIYRIYLKRASLKIGIYLLQQNNKEIFLEFMKQGYFSDSALDKLVLLCSDKQLTNDILKYRNKNELENGLKSIS